MEGGAARSMIESPVVSCLARRYDIVSPADFTLGPGREVAALPPQATPYCVDISRRQLQCVTTPPGIFDHPFLYQAQRESARTVIEIPFAGLPESDVTPALIFSPGRCGSTLLFRLLKAAGLPSVSEPDYFRQIGRMYVMDKSCGKEEGQRLLRAATGILARTLGDSSPVIKLHLESTRAPLLITKAFLSAKVIFIFREHRDWALSIKRAAPATSARNAVIILKLMLTALNRLSQDFAVRICHYRDFSRPDAGYVRELASFLGRDVDVHEQLLQAVASRDSQEGTEKSRQNLDDAAVDPRFLPEFERLWEAERPASIIERHGLAGRI
jgi:hypothetical protein